MFSFAQSVEKLTLSCLLVLHYSRRSKWQVQKRVKLWDIFQFCLFWYLCVKLCLNLWLAPGCAEICEFQQAWLNFSKFRPVYWLWADCLTGRPNWPKLEWNTNKKYCNTLSAFISHKLSQFKCLQYWLFVKSAICCVTLFLKRRFFFSCVYNDLDNFVWLAHSDSFIIFF